jgi:hypothetical protein
LCPDKQAKFVCGDTNKGMKIREFDVIEALFSDGLLKTTIGFDR